LLLNPEDVPGKMRRKVQTAPLSHKALSIQLGLTNRIDAPSHLNAVLPWMLEQHKIFEADGNGAKWPSYSVPTVTMPELGPKGGSIIELYVPAIVSEQDTEWDAQKAEYITAAAIETLSCFHDMEIAAKRVRTPGDFQHKMHLYQGAVYGLSPAADRRAQFPHKTSLPGLYLAGQTTYPGFGVGSAAMSGIFAAEHIV
jgi:phytoene dehydrogenase-like protein